jgi:uncharacterized protein
LAKILVLVVIGFLIWLFFRSAFKATQKPGDNAPQVKTDDVVPCSVCGVHIPKSEALLQDGAYRCSDAETCIHRKA